MRRLYSLFIILTFGVMQVIGLPIQMILIAKNPNMSPAEIIQSFMPYQFLIYVIGATIIIILGNIHKNKNILERQTPTDPAITTLWVIGGLVLAYVSQIATGLINVYLLGNPMESENTSQIIDLIMGSPYMIIFVACLGPIIEEFVFRRAIFAEIYEMIPGNRVVSFLIAGLVAGLIFAVAHFDFTHILIYVGMSYVFSFLYIMTKRLLVPILVHMLMNGIIVLLQIQFKDTIENLDEFKAGLIVLSKTISTIIS